MNEQNTLVSVNEARVILRLSRRGVHNLIERGELPAQKLPGRTGAYVMERVDVEQLRDKRTIRAVNAALGNTQKTA